ncbi:hypothetical protein HDU99_006028 [Rhizoclosmatium hyalinum]|nr:hypothetical protein HDU99_006028 [Rhizoclosmatium hyalinum]
MKRAGSPTATDKSDAKKAKASTESRCFVHWFRNDLRLADNTSLSWVVQEASRASKPVVCLFVISAAEWNQHEMAPAKVRWFLASLESLKENLKERGIPLVVRVSESRRGVPKVVVDTVSELGAEAVGWNWEYEVHEEWRDHTVMDSLEKVGIKHNGMHDQCVIDTSRVRTKEGKPYTVFTPFKKTWIQTIVKNEHLVKLRDAPTENTAPISDTLAAKIETLSTAIPGPSDPLPAPYTESDNPPASVTEFINKTFAPSEKAAATRLATFIESRGKSYKDTRDFPGKDLTSKLSPYLSLGLISPRVCLDAAVKANNGKYDSGNEGLVTWISEICWRDFYRNILIEFPRVCKNLPFKPETDNVEWNYSRDNPLYIAWCEGKTGFPIVDAGMRQLATEGWMHNRVRMIVSSFLTKDLGVDWRLGESWFMRNLIDGDLASNNGGWQWSASTGTDSQPYFRIFNPLLQSERFDPDGHYIRKYVKELSTVKGKEIHDPKGRLGSAYFAKLGYPKPIVDHKTASQAFLAAFKKGIGK